jgi:hypothetical protein
MDYMFLARFVRRGLARYWARLSERPFGTAPFH